MMGKASRRRQTAQKKTTAPRTATEEPSANPTTIVAEPKNKKTLQKVAAILSNARIDMQVTPVTQNMLATQDTFTAEDIGGMTAKQLISHIGNRYTKLNSDKLMELIKALPALYPKNIENMKKNPGQPLTLRLVEICFLALEQSFNGSIHRTKTQRQDDIKLIDMLCDNFSAARETIKKGQAFIKNSYKEPGMYYHYRCTPISYIANCPFTKNATAEDQKHKIDILNHLIEKGADLNTRFLSYCSRVPSEVTFDAFDFSDVEKSINIDDANISYPRGFEWMDSADSCVDPPFAQLTIDSFQDILPPSLYEEKEKNLLKGKIHLILRSSDKIPEKRENFEKIIEDAKKIDALSEIIKTIIDKIMQHHDKKYKLINDNIKEPNLSLKNMYEELSAIIDIQEIKEFYEKSCAKKEPEPSDVSMIKIFKLIPFHLELLNRLIEQEDLKLEKIGDDLLSRLTDTNKQLKADANMRAEQAAIFAQQQAQILEQQTAQSNDVCAQLMTEANQQIEQSKANAKKLRTIQAQNKINEIRARQSQETIVPQKKPPEASQKSSQSKDEKPAAIDTEELRKSVNFIQSKINDSEGLRPKIHTYIQKQDGDNKALTDEDYLSNLCNNLSDSTAIIEELSAIYDTHIEDERIAEKRNKLNMLTTQIKKREIDIKTRKEQREQGNTKPSLSEKLATQKETIRNGAYMSPEQRMYDLKALGNEVTLELNKREPDFLRVADYPEKIKNMETSIKSLQTEIETNEESIKKMSKDKSPTAIANIQKITSANLDMKIMQCTLKLEKSKTHGEHLAISLMTNQLRALHAEIGVFMNTLNDDMQQQAYFQPQINPNSNNYDAFPPL